MDLEAHEIHRYDKALARYETEQALSLGSWKDDAHRNRSKNSQ